MQEVAQYLGNTPAVCRASYIDPRVVDRYLAGQTIARVLESPSWPLEPDAPATQGPIEEAVLDLLELALAPPSSCRAPLRPLHLLDALAQRLHQVDRLRLLGLGGCMDVVAGDLLLDERAKRLRVRVLVLLRPPGAGEALDDVARQLELALR